MSYTMNAAKIFDAVLVANTGGTATSAAIRMDEAMTMSLHTQIATTGGTINVTYTYELSTSNDATAVWITPSAPVTIGTAAALDVLDFAPEAAKFIRITATNNDGSDVTLTTVLCVQEG